jgi:hypothetical protein
LASVKISQSLRQLRHWLQRAPRSIDAVDFITECSFEIKLPVSIFSNGRDDETSFSCSSRPRPIRTHVRHLRSVALPSSPVQRDCAERVQIRIAEILHQASIWPSHARLLRSVWPPDDIARLKVPLSYGIIHFFAAGNVHCANTWNSTTAPNYIHIRISIAHLQLRLTPLSLLRLE